MDRSSHLWFWWLAARRRRPEAVPPAAPVDLKQAITAALMASPAFNSVAGLAIYPGMVPQTAEAPAVAYHISDSEHDMWLGGAAGMREVTVEYELLMPLVSQIEAMAEVLRNRFQGLIGLVSGLRIKWCSLEGQSDQYLEPLPGSDYGTHYKSMRFTYKLRESIPTLT